MMTYTVNMKQFDNKILIEDLIEAAKDWGHCDMALSIGVDYTNSDGMTVGDRRDMDDRHIKLISAELERRLNE
jgi:hypothetical protein